MKLRTLLNEIFEAKQVGKLYHFTPFKGILGILQTNTLKVGDDSNFQSGGNVGNISFTRDKNLEYFRYRITLDGNRLSNNYKIKQYAWHETGRGEAEEYIDRDVKNIKDYILDIHFLTKTYQGRGEANKTDLINLDKIIKIYPNIRFLHKKKEVDYEFVKNFINLKEKNSAKEIDSSETSKTYKYRGKTLTINQNQQDAGRGRFTYTVDMDGKEYDLAKYDKSMGGKAFSSSIDYYVEAISIERVFDNIIDNKEERQTAWWEKV